MHNLRDINKCVKYIHPTVPNPLILLSSLSPDLQVYSDFKDTFFSLSLEAKNQLIFAFEWHDSDQGFSWQLTWTCLQQWFKNFLTIFYETLLQDLRDYQTSHSVVSLFQYVDDLLIACFQEPDILLPDD